MFFCLIRVWVCKLEVVIVFEIVMLIGWGLVVGCFFLIWLVGVEGMWLCGFVKI